MRELKIRFIHDDVFIAELRKILLECAQVIRGDVRLETDDKVVTPDDASKHMSTNFLTEDYSNFEYSGNKDHKRPLRFGECVRLGVRYQDHKRVSHTRRCTENNTQWKETMMIDDVPSLVED